MTLIVTDVVLVSTDSSGNLANQDSLTPVFSPDGTKVIFSSAATNLIPSDTNGAISDLFIKDLITGAVEVVSTNGSGVQGNATSSNARFSADGTKIVFLSSATNLVAGDTNARTDIFVKDLTTGLVTLVSSSSLGTLSNGNSQATPIFSPDGSKVAFTSLGANLVTGDTNISGDIFIKDLVSGVTQRVSTDSSGAQANNFSSTPIFSPDGTKLFFLSLANNLVTGDTNGTQDAFMKDLTTGVTTRISLDAANAQQTGTSTIMGVTPDGTQALFLSFGAFIAGDTNAKADLYLKDLTTGAVTLVSTDSNGNLGDGHAAQGAISADGRYLAFTSAAANLVAGDTNGKDDVFVKDLITGETVRVSTDDTGAQGNDFSTDVSFSADGTRLVITSLATNLVAGDTNARRDVFVIDIDQDCIEGDANPNLFLGSEDPDCYKGLAGNDTIMGAGDNDTLDGGADRDSISGGEGDDSLIGGIGIDTIAGGNGLDTIEGGDNSDVVYGEAGDDSILSGKGDDTVDAGEDNDYVSGDNGADHISGQDGNDTLLGDTGNDTLLGGDGTDDLQGLAGNDSLDGGLLNDTLNGGTGHDTLTGGEGDDSLRGHDGDDSMEGGAGNDLLYANAGMDTLVGGEGDDYMRGQEANDILIGSSGVDTMYGDAGSDTFIFTAVTDSPGGWLLPRDTIRDFAQGQDKIDLLAFDGTFNFLGAGAFTGAGNEVNYQIVGTSHTVVNLDIDGDLNADMQFNLTGVVSLSGGDFLL